ADLGGDGFADIHGRVILIHSRAHSIRRLSLIDAGVFGLEVKAVFQELQIAEETSDCFVAVVALLAQRLVQTPLEFRRDASYELRDRSRLADQDRRDHVARCRALERRAAPDHLVKHYAEAEDVAARVNA